MIKSIGLKNAINTVYNNVAEEIEDFFVPVFKNENNDVIAKKIACSDFMQKESLNVIIINPSLKENIEGKEYKTFNDAMAYMTKQPISSSDTLPKFKVNLPFGDFEDDITLDERWIINGNDTTLNGHITTNSVSKTINTESEDKISLKNCIIKGGFVPNSYAIENEEISIYKISDCSIYKFGSQESECYFYMNRCVIDNSEYDKDIRTSIYNAFNCSVFNNCTIISAYNVSGQNAIFNNCILKGQITSPSDSPSNESTSYTFSNCISTNLTGVEFRFYKSNVQFSNCNFTGMSLYYDTNDTEGIGGICNFSNCNLLDTNTIYSEESCYITMDNSKCYFNDNSEESIRFYFLILNKSELSFTCYSLNRVFECYHLDVCISSAAYTGIFYELGYENAERVLKIENFTVDPSSSFNGDLVEKKVDIHSYIKLANVMYITTADMPAVSDYNPYTVNSTTQKDSVFSIDSTNAKYYGIYKQTLNNNILVFNYKFMYDNYIWFKL